jgi:hypothetical protein
MDQSAGEMQIATNYLKALVQVMGQWITTTKQVFPFISSTATSATAGTNGAPPAQVAGYINMTLPNGTSAKVPYYNP